MSRPVAAILTLGCKLNTADSGELAHSLRGHGFDVVEALCEADAVVINTCSVTHVADAKSRKLIHSVRRVAPGARVAVTGCFPQSAGHDAVRELGADFVAGSRDADKAALVEFLAPLAGAVERSPGVVDPALAATANRAFIKAQEGCNDVCAFCIVPRTRGREESRPVARVVAEVERAATAGAHEIVVTGTQLGAWGRDFEVPLKPHHLIAGLLEHTEVPRIRFSSLQPQDITPELLGLWSDPRLMPHFHLALQSGSEATLRAMRRRYTAREFALAAERIRAAVPGVAITTDVIAGFPGETEEEFAETLALCRDVGFARIHAFPYSPRARTLAERLPGQVALERRKERMARLLQLGEELARTFVHQFEGTARPVLWESLRAGSPQRPLDQETWFGHTDNYIAVYTNARNLRSRVTLAQLGRVYDDGVWGTIPGEAV